MPVTRKTPQEEIDHARYGPPPNMVKRAASKNRQAIRKAKEQAGPLFSEHVVAEVRLTDPVTELRKWEQGKRLGAEHNMDSNKMIAWLRLYAIEHHASKLIDPETYSLVKVYIRKTYPMPDFGPMMWADALTGKCRIPYRLHIEPNLDKPGWNRITGTDYFPAEGHPMTRPEFDALFTIPTVEKNDGGPDAAMLDRFLATIANRAA